MLLKKWCVVAALAATLSTLAACNGGEGSGYPLTPSVPGSVDGGPDMPETTEPPESAEPPPQGGSVVPQPLGVPVVVASSNPSPLPSASGKPIAANVRTAAAFTLRSTTFKDGKFVPLTMVRKGNGCDGGNMSPELQWTGAPKKAKSFAVLMFDATAKVEHWGMYGISKTSTNLPRNAATASSKYGKQVLSYDGPCPPRGKAHHYVFTLDALDTALSLSPSARVEDLNVAIRGHVLGSASIAGLYKR